MWKCASLLDVFLLCFAQNEDENRASESKKTKLEEKAPSGHKNSSSREWVSLLCPALRVRVAMGRMVLSCPPFSSLPPQVFLKELVKFHFFLPFKQIWLQSFYKQLVEVNFHPQKHWPRAIVLLNKVRWPLLWRECFLPGFLWYTVGLGLGVEIKICAFKLTPAGNSLSSKF